MLACRVATSFFPSFVVRTGIHFDRYVPDPTGPMAVAVGIPTSLENISAQQLGFWPVDMKPWNSVYAPPTVPSPTAPTNDRVWRP